MSRRDLMLAQEGAFLSLAGNCGSGVACDQARAVIDGAMNALIRLEGRREAAGFAFNVADRVAGGLKGETLFMASGEWIAGPDDEDDDAEEAAASLAEYEAEQASRPTNDGKPGLWFSGFGAGALAALFVVAVM